jgi:hypothetical protein
MNPQLNYKDYILLFIAVLTFFASLFCALRIPSNAPDIMASIGLGIVSILFFIVFIFSKNQDEDSLLDSASKLAETQFDSFIETYKSMLDLIFEEIEAMDFSTTPLDDIRSYRDFLAMYAHTQTPELSLDKHEKIKFLNTQLDEIIKSHPLAPIPEPCPITGLPKVIRQKLKGEPIRQSFPKQQPEPCPITALQEEIKQKLEEQAVLPGSITRVEYDNLLDISTPRLPFQEAILPQLLGFAQTENKVTFGVDANESGFAPTSPEPIPMPLLPLPAETIASFTKYEDLLITGKLESKEQDGNPEPIYLGIPSVPDEEEMQKLKEQAATVATDIIADAIKASPKRTKSGRFAKKSK